MTEWLRSPYLDRVALRAAKQYGLPAQEVPDILQELRLALWQAGADRRVNVTWIFHTAQHKAVDLVRSRSRRSEEAMPNAGSLAASGGETGGSRAPMELVHLLRARAAGLPESLRRFYSLRYEEGLSQRELAEHLAVCRGFIRGMDRRCLRLVAGYVAIVREGPATHRRVARPGAASTARLVPRSLSLPRREAPPRGETPRAAKPGGCPTARLVPRGALGMELGNSKVS